MLPLIYAVNGRGRNNRRRCARCPDYGQPGVSAADPRGKARPGGGIVAALEAAAGASPRGSKSFVLPGAIVSLRSCPRGQARSGQDGKGAGNIGRWCGTSTILRAAVGGGSTRLLGGSPAGWVVRSRRATLVGLRCAWGGGSGDAVRRAL